uniref:uncharacterized protein LOC114603082 n=1 Tax=Podarcis muralis TaxID=64176 RepID=UPI0010A06500|nr:uncharacterized protein LOC114603082 [Podarcis muralis]XP_028597649.1 uncharacterized protein LOC114603082 [Podarcis muralis]
MQTSLERITEAHLTLSYDINKFPSLGGEASRKSLISRPSPGGGGSVSKPEAGEQYPSGRAFFKGRCPFWLKRKGAANPPQVAPKSRLCMEATHESPIQAVRKPATREDAQGPDSDEESVRGKTGTSLLRKLLCLKTPSGPEASPAQRARVRCGPVAALSRTADPHGESPLKWKPRAKAPIPAEASSIAETAAADPVDRLVGWWVTKPWRAFRAMLRSRAKKRSVLPESKRSPKVVEERDIRLATEPETSPIARVDGSPRFSATEDKTLASDMGETQEEDEGEHLSSRCGLEIHGRAEDDISDPATEREVDELCTFLSEGRRLREESRGLRGVFEWRGTCHLPGGDGVEAEDVADQAPELGDYRYWAGASDGEEQALADLAENPGGQGMLMATRDLGWLNSELLASPVLVPKEKRGREVSATSNPESRENGRVAGASRETQHIHQEVLHLSSGLDPPPASPPGRSDPLEADPYDAPKAHIVEEERAPSPDFPQTLLTLLEPPPSFPSGGQGLQEGPPPLRPCQALAEDGGREVCQRRGSSGRKLPSPTEETAAEPGEEDDKQRLYQAAVEIVGAAIDAAAEQLAKAAEREQGELGSRREVP